MATSVSFKELMHNALILAKEVRACALGLAIGCHWEARGGWLAFLLHEQRSFDVFNALEIMENGTVFAVRCETGMAASSRGAMLTNHSPPHARPLL